MNSDVPGPLRAGRAGRCATAVTKKTAAAIKAQPRRSNPGPRIKLWARNQPEWRMKMVPPDMTAAALDRRSRSPQDGEWLQITPGERARFHVSSVQTMGAFAMIELIVEPGKG